jgi:hypothetical protein
LRRWAEEHPEEAAAIAGRVFAVDVPQEYIRLQNKKRKIRGELRAEREEKDKTFTAREAALKAEVQRAEAVINGVKPVADMWAAASRRDDKGAVLKDQHGQPLIDFDLADEAFRINMGGVTFDDYARLRARRGMSNPQLAAERGARLRAERELAALKGSPKTETAKAGEAPSQPAAPPAATPAASPAAALPKVDWDAEIDAEHPLREFGTWAKDLEKEMLKYYDADLDEYSRDTEDVANELLERKMSKLRPEPAAPAPKPRAGNGRPNTPKRRAARELGDGELPDPASMAPKTPVAPRNHRQATPDDLAPEPKDFVARERWALERAQRRIRGEQVD